MISVHLCDEYSNSLNLSDGDVISISVQPKDINTSHSCTCSLESSESFWLQQKVRILDGTGLQCIRRGRHGRCYYPARILMPRGNVIRVYYPARWSFIFKKMPKSTNVNVHVVIDLIYVNNHGRFCFSFLCFTCSFYE